MTTDLRAEPTVPADDDEVVAELARRSRLSGTVLAIVSMVVLPCWAPFDLYLQPELAPLFITVRLLCVVPLAGLLWLLAVSRLGRQNPELLSVLVLGVVQAGVLWMVTQVEHVASYGLGLSLALFGCGGVFTGRLLWTALLAGGTWAGLALAVAANGQDVSGAQLVPLAVYMVTATVVALVTHTVRQTLTLREVRTTVGLHREQERTRVLMARLERLSHEDPLTGLANRRRWDAELARACASAARGDGPVAVVLLDVDHFKQVNDRYGHAGGDAALCAVAGLLRDAVRGDDVVARLGGDELAVLLPAARVRPGGAQRLPRRRGGRRGRRHPHRSHRPRRPLPLRGEGDPQRRRHRRTRLSRPIPVSAPARRGTQEAWRSARSAATTTT